MSHGQTPDGLLSALSRLAPLLCLGLAAPSTAWADQPLPTGCGASFVWTVLVIAAGAFLLGLLRRLRRYRRLELTRFDPKARLDDLLASGMLPLLTPAEAAFLDGRGSRALTALLADLVCRGVVEVKRTRALTLAVTRPDLPLQRHEKVLIDALDRDGLVPLESLERVMLELAHSVRTKLWYSELEPTRSYYRQRIVSGWEEVARCPTRRRAERAEELLPWLLQDAGYHDRMEMLLRAEYRHSSPSPSNRVQAMKKVSSAPPDPSGEEMPEASRDIFDLIDQLILLLESLTSGADGPDEGEPDLPPGRFEEVLRELRKEWLSLGADLRAVLNQAWEGGRDRAREEVQGLEQAVEDRRSVLEEVHGELLRISGGRTDSGARTQDPGEMEAAAVVAELQNRVGVLAARLERSRRLTSRLLRPELLLAVRLEGAFALGSLDEALRRLTDLRSRLAEAAVSTVGRLRELASDWESCILVMNRLAVSHDRFQRKLEAQAFTYGVSRYLESLDSVPELWSDAPPVVLESLEKALAAGSAVEESTT